MAMGHAGPGIAKIESDVKYSPLRTPCVTKLIADVPKIQPSIPKRVNTRTVF